MPSESQSRPRSARSGLKVLAVGIGLVLVLVVLYVASIGPVARMANAGAINARTWHRIYAPVTWASDQSAAAKAAYWWCLNAGTDEITLTPLRIGGGPSVDWQHTLRTPLETSAR